MTLRITSAKKFAKKPDMVMVWFDILYNHTEADNSGMKSAKDLLRRELSINQNSLNTLFQSRDRGDHSNPIIYFQKLMEKMTNKTNSLLTLDLEQAYLRTFLSNAKLNKGAVDFIISVKAAGVPLIILDNNPVQMVLRKLVYLELDNYIDYAVSMEEGDNIYETAGIKLPLRKKNVAWIVAAETPNEKSFGKYFTPVVITNSKGKADGKFTDFGELSEIFQHWAA